MSNQYGGIICTATNHNAWPILMNLCRIVTHDMQMYTIPPFWFDIFCRSYGTLITFFGLWGNLVSVTPLKPLNQFLCKFLGWLQRSCVHKVIRTEGWTDERKSLLCHFFPSRRVTKRLYGGLSYYLAVCLGGRHTATCSNLVYHKVGVNVVI
jgi:hypothetical protein